MKNNEIIYKNEQMSEEELTQAVSQLSLNEIDELLTVLGGDQ